MKQLKELLSMESRKCDSYEKFVIKQCRWKNEATGSLNELDGIQCDLCKNKGWIYEVENDEIFAKKCKCMNKRNSVMNAKRSGLGELLNHSVNDYVATEEWQQQIKSLAIEYVTSDSRNWFCILGQSGSGKTMICSALTKTLINKGLEARYIVWNTFVKEMKSDMPNVADKMYPYQKVDVLYIDDLLKGNFTETDVTLAFDLINYRYNNNLITLVTSELSANELINIDSAIAGRIKERCNQYFIEIKKDNKKNFRFKKVEEKTK